MDRSSPVPFDADVKCYWDTTLRLKISDVKTVCDTSMYVMLVGI